MPFDEREFLVLEQGIGARLQVVLDELRLVIKQILLRRPARHVQINHSLGFGREMRRPGLVRVVGRSGQTAARRLGFIAQAGAPALREHPQSNGAQPSLRRLQELPASLRRANCNFQGRSRSMGISLWSRRHQDSRVHSPRWSRRPDRPVPFRVEEARSGRWRGTRRPSSPWRTARIPCVKGDQGLDLLGPGRPAQAELQAMASARQDRRTAVADDPPGQGLGGLNINRII